MAQKENSFIDYLYILVKWRKFIVIVCLSICVITAIISLIMNKTYSASAIILPPTQDEQGLGLSSILSNLPMMGLGSAAISQDAFTFMAILNSRSMMETVINEFDLIKKYDAEDIELAVKELRENVGVKLNDDGTISVSANASTKFFPSSAAEDSVRKLSSDMANFLVSELDRVNKKLRSEKAKNYRVFIEKRYFQNLNDLEKAENAYNEFQKEYGAVDLPVQTQAAIQAAATLKAEIVAKEVEVNSLESVFTKSHSTYKRAQTELDNLNKKYNEFLRGQKGGIVNGGEESKDIFIPFEDVPEIGLKYARLFRELMLQEKLLEFMLPQYEQAKIQEAKDTPTLQVLDKAVPPFLRAKPKRALMVIVVGFLSFVLCAMFVFSLEYLHRVKNSESEDDTMKRIVEELQNDFRKLLKKKDQKLLR